MAKIPDAEFLGENLDERPTFFFDGYTVAEWTPERDGKGKPEEVCFVLPVDMGDVVVHMILRLKTRVAVDKLIACLARHRDSVFPQ